MWCPECNLPDHYNGQGDGIGSCDCPRCETCGAADPAGFCEAQHAIDEVAGEGMDDWSVDDDA